MDKDCFIKGVVFLLYIAISFINIQINANGLRIFEDFSFNKYVKYN